MSSLFRRPRCRPLFLFSPSLLSPCVALFFLHARVQPILPPIVYTAIGSGFGVALVWRMMQERTGEGGRRSRGADVVQAASTSGGKKRGGRSHVGSKGGDPTKQARCPALAKAVVQRLWRSAGCGLLHVLWCCRVGVCLVCVMQCISRTLTHKYTSPESDDARLGWDAWRGTTGIIILGRG